MKRPRDESVGAPSSKRPAASVTTAETPPPANAPMESAGQRLTTDDALAYLKAVKEKFKDDKEKYDEFLEVMKDFKAQRIDTAGVIGRVKDLFKGHRALILGFNTFLPKGYEISMPVEEEAPPKKQPVEFDQAINYVNKIKTRFQADEHVYKAFLEILNMYRKGNKTIIEVYHEVATLFKDHSDLLEEFTYFLPDTSGTNTAIPVPQQPAASLAPSGGVKAPVGIVRQVSLPVKKEEKPVSISRRIPSKTILVAKKEKGATSVDQKPGVGETSAIQKPLERNEKAVEREKPEKSEKDIEEKKIKEEKREREKDRDRDREKKEADREKEKDALARREDRRKSARRADELIRRQSNHGETATGAGPSGAAPDEKRLGRGGMNLSKEMAFFEKVKGRLRNKDQYQDFLKCLNIFSQEIITRAELINMVKGILKKFPDLLEGFHDFLSRCENLELELPEGPKPKISHEVRDAKEGREVREHREPSGRERVSDAPSREAREIRDERLRSQAPAEGNRMPVHPPPKDMQRIGMLVTKEKFSNKPVSELDLSNCERCTPSYRLLPKSYPRPLSSHRTDLGLKVLNDNWVSVTSGSEDYSFKHMRKNQYEESLFRCEDDRFELDMLLESTAVTAKKLAELVERVKAMNAEQKAAFRIDENLSAINMRCIERIYGDHGLDVVELLRKSPVVALPVILDRLKQKQEEWQKCRTDMNKVWAEVYAKNYHKSLDHRSFYFKQQDKKNLSIKGLLAEIKEINDKKRQQDENLLAIAAGNRRPLFPDFVFEYSDLSIHEDLYQIVKFSAEEVCNSLEQSERIMRFWTTFVEPLFGVPPRQHGVEDTLETAAKMPKGVAMQASMALVTGPGSHGNGSAEGDNMNSHLGDVEGLAKRSDSAANGMGEVEGDAVRLNQETIAGDASLKDTGTDVVMLDQGATSEIHRTAETAYPAADSDECKEEAIREDAGRAMETEGRQGRAANVAGAAEADDAAGLSAGRDECEEIELSPSPPPEAADGRQQSRRLPVGISGGRANGGLENGLMKHDRRHHEEDDDGDADADHEADDADDEGEEEGEKSSEESEENASGDDDEASDEHDDHDDREDHDEEDEDEEHEGKGAESEGEAEGGADADGDGTASPASPDRSFILCKPLAPHPASVEAALGNAAQEKKQGDLFYGSDAFYVLFRLHQTLYERILSAKTNARTAEQKWKSSKDGNPPDLYAKFIHVLYNLLDGTIENSKFEDECRAIIGTHSYVLFTIDKLIYKFVKQLQATMADDMSTKMLGLHGYEKARAPDGFVDMVYQSNACTILHDENIYRIEHVSNPSSRLFIQLMEEGQMKLDVSPGALEISFSNYLNDFLQSIPDVKDQRVTRVFLQRNVKRLPDEDEGMAIQRALEGTDVLNGLECKISCNTSKVSYVLDTEDVFRRRKRRRDDETDGGRKKRAKIQNGAFRFQQFAAQHASGA
eukprot:TRINITY_DN14179_c0_g1_i2.p1 TRINITY_DN14179_c0_g1~~TRINITY_DN14179_c0_g1_i2.p1  ORF type:complete len:1452 (-),score=385.29 TRINITY_DN14179_c0_g1_i2:688-5043(-)